MMNNHELIWNLLMTYEYVSLDGTPIPIHDSMKTVSFSIASCTFAEDAFGTFKHLC